MPTDIEIAQKVTLKPIQEVAARINLKEDDLQFYGKYKAKLPLRLIDEKQLQKCKLILVTAISPTPAGEGKTTVSIGLSEAMNQIGKQTTVVLREPSLGPVFGIKGGATGGGYSQVLPMEDINLHFTGDFAAIEKAHNLLAALIDNNIQSKTESLGIDPRTILWKRVMDMNDRALRKTVIGLGGTGMGIPRETGFDITAASEIMAILCLSDSFPDLKERLGNIFVGFTRQHKPIYARDIHAPGAMAALMKDAIMPNLVQTIEGNPAIIHGGPFANIAQGTNTVIATKMGMSLSDYVVTEAGFGADLGAEKFFGIKCQSAGLSPNAVVLVATIKALKYHGGLPLKSLSTPSPESVKKGICNLEKHIENVQHFNVPVVVAINRFTSDTEEEIQTLKNHFSGSNIKIIDADVWGQGGAGTIELAKAVTHLADNHSEPFTPVYKWKWTVRKKIEALALKIYGADSVHYATKAKRDLTLIRKLGLTGLPVCVAKTPVSLSDNPQLLGRPGNYRLHVREIEIASGAGFLIPITGDTMRMPGLPSVPAANNIDIDDDGNITGLF